MGDGDVMGDVVSYFYICYLGLVEGTLLLLLLYSDFTAHFYRTWKNEGVLPKNASSHKNQQILSVQQKMQIVFLA